MTINRVECEPELKKELAKNEAEMKPQPEKLGKNEKSKMQQMLENDEDKVEKMGEVSKSELKEKKQPDFTIEMEYMAEMEAEGHQLDDYFNDEMLTK